MEKSNNTPAAPFVAAKIDKVLNGNGATKAFATISIANSFMVHNIRVVEGAKGLFVSMPNQQFTDRNGDKKYSDICHAITSEMKQRIDLMVLNAYHQTVAQEKTQYEAFSKQINSVPLDKGLPFDYVQGNAAPQSQSMKENGQYQGQPMQFLPGYAEAMAAKELASSNNVDLEEGLPFDFEQSM